MLRQPATFPDDALDGAEQTADVIARTAEDHLRRGIARLALGRDDDARADLLAALDAGIGALRQRARIELTLLDMRQGGRYDAGFAAAMAIADQVESSRAVRARALHVAGWAAGKLRHTGRALELLHAALDTWRDLGQRAEASHVTHTLGEVCAARGQLDHALSYFAMSLVEKTRANDRVGIALSMGSIGRVHLCAGRFKDALEAFHIDLEIATEVGDRRGQARMHEDIGRAYMGLGDLDSARRSFDNALRLAVDGGFADLRLFARKDLALCHIERHDLDAAQHLLDAAERELGSDDGIQRALLQAAQGSLLQARGDALAIGILRQAIATFTTHDLPDQEIPARILLARALVEQRNVLDAERCLSHALEIARVAGLTRYCTPLREEMVALQLVEAATHERDRRLAAIDESRRQNDYVAMRRLGAGRFGEVFLALDVQRDRRVAFKRLRIGDAYDARARARVLASIRLELDAASRIRHPGVARVLAIGSEDGGDAYVIQEYVDGETLTAHMPAEPTAHPDQVLPTIAGIASALAELHGHGVIHRDLKPGNIMLRADRTPVLIDFGIAQTRLYREPFGAGSAVGTLAYMPEEQAVGMPSPKSDVFALGVILYQWLSGSLPRNARTDGDPMEVLWEPLRPIEQLRPDLSAELRNLIRSMLASRGADRPTAAEVASACRDLGGAA